jgi:predicted nucleotidyltransferase
MNGMNWRDFVDSFGGASDSGIAMDEEVSPESFDTHDNLEPSLWLGTELKPHIEKRLVKIASNFMKNLPVVAPIEDIRLTGSLANYNWSNYSDVDLHIVVDFLQVDENLDLVKAFFDNARMRWNQNHHIRIKGYDVEIYVEDAREKHLSSGVYSVLKGEWLKKPKKYKNHIDFSSARKKAEDLEFQVSIVGNLITARKFKTAFKNIERLKKKIKNMRRAGLESHLREFSVENIAFKILRRDGTLETLSDLKTKLYDTMLSVSEE